MAYDLHIVQAADWMDASANPISKDEINHLIAADPTLAWSDQDFVDTKSDTGADEVQISKLLRIAELFDASVVGDDGEKYELRKNLLGKERIVTV